MRRRRTVAVIGLGLIGGSLALALKRSGLYTVHGYDAAAAVVAQAVAQAAVDEGFDRLTAVVSQADVVVFCLPVRRIAAAVAEAAPALPAGAVVTDVASTKGELLEAIPPLLPPGTAYVGGHPMTGSEKSGFAAARADLFDRRPYVLTRSADTDRRALARVAAMVRHIGATPVVVDGAVHDEVAATISHVPHLVAAALAVLATRGRQPELNRRLAAGGFRDMTRIAASDPALWTEICLSNRREIIDRLRELQMLIDGIIVDLAQNHTAGVTAFLRQAQDMRRSLAGDITRETKEGEHAGSTLLHRFARCGNRTGG